MKKNPNKLGRGIGGMAPPNRPLAVPSKKGAGRSTPTKTLKKGSK